MMPIWGAKEPDETMTKALLSLLEMSLQSHVRRNQMVKPVRLDCWWGL
ncbi:hypothetical protein CCP4SC76_3010023 [Gammaproteobacteria bacterium]